MSAIELLEELARKNFQLSLDGERLQVRSPKGQMSPQLRARLVAQKSEIIELLRRRLAAALALEPVPRDRPLPLSFAQERQWRLQALGANSQITEGAVFSGHLDLTALRRSFIELYRRHEIIRTTYATGDGRPVQIVHPPRSGTLPLVDLSTLPAAAREAEVERLTLRETQRPFDLTRGPVVRATLLRLEPREHIVLLASHHIAGDYRSFGIITQELATLYGAFAAGRPSPLPELPIQYADFAVWQRRTAGDALTAHLGYWRAQLDGAPALLHLPTDRPRPAVRTFRGKQHPFELTAELTAALKELGRRAEATLFMTLLAALQALLHYLTGEHDVVIGSPVSTRAEIHGLIGCFIDLLALRTDLSGDPTFIRLLSRAREVTLGAYAHQDLSFEKLVEELRLERDPSYPPLFQVVLNYGHAPRPRLELPQLALSTMPIASGRSMYDLVFYIGERDARLRGALKYNVALFEAQTVEEILEDFVLLLHQVAKYPETRLSTLVESLNRRSGRRLASPLVSTPSTARSPR